LLPTVEEELSDDGKHSLLQFALRYFRSDKFNLSPETIDKNHWTWREQISLVKYSPKMIDVSLLDLHSEDNNRLAIECFASLLKYMGDDNQNSGVEAVYTILRVRFLRGVFVNPNLNLSFVLN